MVTIPRQNNLQTGSPSYANIIKVLNLVRSEADIGEIEDAIKVTRSLHIA